MKKALLIGINYKNTSVELRGCLNDTKNIKQFLTNHCDYQEKDIRILNDDISDFLPTKQNIINYIEWLLKDIIPGDTLIFYFSGHGIFTIDSSNDESDNKDEMLVPLDYEQSGFITDDWISENLIQKIPENVTLWAFMDCCHSGTILDLKYNYQSKCTPIIQSTFKKNMLYNPKEWTDNYNMYFEKSIEVKGNIYLLTGCQDEQQSSDAFISNQFQGAFTYCLIESLKNKLITTSNGMSRLNTSELKLKDLLKEINARLKINGFNSQFSQLSVSKLTDVDKTFEL